MVDDGGLAKLQKRLAAIPADVKAAARLSTMKQAEAMADIMRTLVPEKSGDLKDSIAVTPGGEHTPPFSQPGGSVVVPELSAVITVGNEDVRYPHLVEFGHKASGFSKTDVPAKPFFWPAVRLGRKRAQRNIKSGVARAVKKNWGKS